MLRKPCHLRKPQVLAKSTPDETSRSLIPTNHVREQLGDVNGGPSFQGFFFLRAYKKERVQLEPLMKQNPSPATQVLTSWVVA